MGRVRRAVWFLLGTAALALALLSPSPAGAQALVSAGAEFQVNTFTTSPQRLPPRGSCHGTSSWRGKRYGSSGLTRAASTRSSLTSGVDAGR